MRLNEKELRREYLSRLKFERVEFGFFGFLIMGAFIYGIILIAEGFWKLLVILPLLALFGVIAKIKDLNQQIKENSQKSTKRKKNVK